jgi:signal transduction histidine kinase
LEVDGLFEPFRRLASSERITDGGRAVSSRGAGLGLSIVRSVALAHGGDVRAEARPDGGLVVTVTLPFRQ